MTLNPLSNLSHDLFPVLASRAQQTIYTDPHLQSFRCLSFQSLCLLCLNIPDFLYFSHSLIFLILLLFSVSIWPLNYASQTCINYHRYTQWKKKCNLSYGTYLLPDKNASASSVWDHFICCSFGTLSFKWFANARSFFQITCQKGNKYHRIK